MYTPGEREHGTRGYTQPEAGGAERGEPEPLTQTLTLTQTQTRTLTLTLTLTLTRP